MTTNTERFNKFMHGLNEMMEAIGGKAYYKVYATEADIPKYGEYDGRAPLYRNVCPEREYIIIEFAYGYCFHVNVEGDSERGALLDIARYIEDNKNHIQRWI